MIWAVGVLSLSTLYLGIQHYNMQRLQNDLSLQLFEQQQDNEWLERQLQLTQAQLKNSQAHTKPIKTGHIQAFAPSTRPNSDVEDHQLTAQRNVAGANNANVEVGGNAHLQAKAIQTEEEIKRTPNGVIY